MKEAYLNAHDFSCVTGSPLRDVLYGMRTGEIPFLIEDGERLIPLSHVYPELFDSEE